MPRIPLKPFKTPYQSFLQRWSKGCGSELCDRACNIVLGRGHVPCDVLFVGEGPGRSEDTLGIPFCGPAGHLLNQIVEQAIPDSVGPDPRIRVTFTNLVGCIPIYEGNTKEEEPAHDDVMRCQPRLKEFIDLCNPVLVVAVGKIAKDYLDPSTSYRDRVRLPVRSRFLHIIHPAAILRAGFIHQGMRIEECIVDVRDAVKEALAIERYGGG